MPVKRTIPVEFGMFFITFTCYKWINLIEKVNGFDIVYNWFNHLKLKGHFINGYVIMPNHVHALISFRETGQSINTIIGNGKRFMAYEIIERLKNGNEMDVLRYLKEAVEPGRQANKKQHKVWELSFDWKECSSKKFIQQKLDYMHMNPCSKKWNLCSKPQEYVHSSAKYYTTGEEGFYPITDFMAMEDIKLCKTKI